MWQGYTQETGGRLGVEAGAGAEGVCCAKELQVNFDCNPVCPHESLKREAAAAPVAATSWLRLSRSPSTPRYVCPQLVAKHSRKEEQQAEARLPRGRSGMESRAKGAQAAMCGMWRVWQAASSGGQLQLPPLPPLTGKVCNENFLVKTKLKCEKMFNRIENKAERERVRERGRVSERERGTELKRAAM